MGPGRRSTRWGRRRGGVAVAAGGDRWEAMAARKPGNSGDDPGRWRRRWGAVAMATLSGHGSLVTAGTPGRLTTADGDGDGDGTHQQQAGTIGDGGDGSGGSLKEPKRAPSVTIKEYDERHRRAPELQRLR